MSLLVNGKPATLELGPTFPTDLVVGEGWKVSLSADGRTLSVGCKQFNAPLFYGGLHNLCKGGTIFHIPPVNASDDTLTFRAARDGVQFDMYSVSWPDADRLLAALVEYFKAKEVA